MRSSVLPWVNVYEKLSKDHEVQYGFWRIIKMVDYFGSLHTSKQFCDEQGQIFNLDKNK